MLTAKDISRRIEQGNRVKFIPFWGHENKTANITKSCFSQWYNAPFSEEEISYPTSEHYMMAQKAKLFSDIASYQKVINSKSPGEAKMHGRSISNFVEETWEKNRVDIVRQANLLKFGQNTKLGDFLISTGDRVLVEASPTDIIWGVGLAANDPELEDPAQWRGLNLLGFTLMDVREEL